MLFKELGLSEEILAAIEELGFESPTPIQEKVIPAFLEEKRDVTGLAQTGTGKTAAFGLPALHYIEKDKNYPQLLVMSPTRELCLQITRDLENFSKYMKQISIVAVYGGAPIDKQIKALRKGAHIVVATPGRIHDLVRRRKVDLAKVSMLVLDEADEMLKMGFREDVDAILDQTPVNKTTLLFSATMSKDIMNIARTYMNDPIEITIGKKNASTENVSHIYHMVHARDRYLALKRIVDFYPEIYGIVFCRTRQETKDVAAHLMKDGYNAEALHGDLTQAQRDYVMDKFRDKNLSILVATDVAARGLDVNNLTHVINYNLPDDVENYNHRTGRTGRAGKQGTAISIINMKEMGKIRDIERVIKRKFDHKEIPNGPEICERQLFNIIDKMQDSKVEHEQIDPYLDRVNEKLGDLSREDLLKKFVALEFNRILDYYKNAPDLNVKDRKTFGKEGKPSVKGMKRIVFNVGVGKGINKRGIIDMVVKGSGVKDVEIGQIEVFKRASAVEIEPKYLKKVLKSLNNSYYKGVKIEAEENNKFRGNDFRDRNKGPRGKRKRTNHR